MKVALLIIGDEVLNGTTQDTNSRFISKILNQHGFQVTQTLVTSDSSEAIKHSIGYLFNEADLVISTGGLGPTKDDITKFALAEYFDCGMTFNDSIYKYLKERYEKRNIPLNKLNQSQAMIPELATFYTNTVGTAPVLWLEKNGKTLIAFPGVPKETEFLFGNMMIHVLDEKFLQEEIVQRNVLTVGIAESKLAMLLEDLEEEIFAACKDEEKYKLAYLPNLSLLKLQITGIGKDRDKLKSYVDYIVHEIEERAQEYIYGYDQDIFASYIGKIIRERNATLSTAESCTGGYLSHLITSVTGSSSYFEGAIVSYSKKTKHEMLNVKYETLEKYSSVSEETLDEMLEGCLKKFGTTYAIAVTGLSGPTGDDSDKPVGEVWIGVADKYHAVKKKVHYDCSRLDNIHLTSIAALDMLRRLILGLEV